MRAERPSGEGETLDRFRGDEAALEREIVVAREHAEAGDRRRAADEGVGLERERALLLERWRLLDGATSRRINALEQLLLPALSREAARVEAALEERDREDAVRRKRFRARRAGEVGTGPRP